MNTVIRTAAIKKRKLSPAWIIPVCALVIALYLGWQTLSEEGPHITISYNSADGLVAGQTQIKYKAVPLGTVTSIAISNDHKKVIVRARMTKEAKSIITDQTRFWVVRPRLSYGNISGFETLVSGAYIQCDPGAQGGEFKSDFVGLEEPDVRIDEPGTIYTLVADKLGPINMGSPVYFRDIEVGEVSRYDLGDGFKPIKISVFVRAPYDKFVHKETRFWNASGLSFSMQPSGLKVQFQSLQSVIAGGISFTTDAKWRETAEAPKESEFKLYSSKHEAEVSDMKQIPFVAYFDNPVQNIAAGSSVSLYGIPVGEVTDVQLLVDPDKGMPKVRVKFVIEPQRVMSADDGADPAGVMKNLVENGLRVTAASGLLLPQGSLSLALAAKTKKENVVMEDGAIVIPVNASGGMDAIVENITDITRKIDQMPFAQIGNNVNSSLEGINQQSDLQRSAKQTLDQINDAARSIRLLTDFLSRHPEALIRGRSSKEN